MKAYWSKAHEGQIYTEEQREKVKALWTEEKRQQARERATKQKFKCISKIEVKMWCLLFALKVGLIKVQEYIDIPHGYRVDIFVPSLNLVIECDGCYWHGCKQCFPDGKATDRRGKYILGQKQERDKIHTQELQQTGYKVLRLWGHEIKHMTAGDLQKRIDDKMVEKTSLLLSA